MHIDEDEVKNLLSKLVSINSVNPNIESGKGEIELSSFIADYLERMGVKVQTQDVVDGRFNVIGILEGSGEGKNIMFNGHSDTVGVRNMAIDPFKPFIENGRLHGRGSCDMKGGITAMLIALKKLVESDIKLKGDVVFSLVVGEEYDNIGTNKLVKDYCFHRRPHAVIVGEPTSLQLAIKHKGFTLIQVDVKGKAAHGSIPEEGIDAIDKMARLIVGLGDLKRAFVAIKNEMLGPPKMHMSMIEGGREWSVVPDSCTLKLEVRTIPEYTSSRVVEDINKVIERLSHEDPDFKAAVKLCLAGEPLNTSPEEPLVDAVRSAIRKVRGDEPQILGMPFYTEAAIYASELGIPAVLIGPGDIKQAHAPDEFVEIDEVVKASAIYYITAHSFANAQ